MEQKDEAKEKGAGGCQLGNRKEKFGFEPVFEQVLLNDPVFQASGARVVATGREEKERLLEKVKMSERLSKVRYRKEQELLDNLMNYSGKLRPSQELGRRMKTEGKRNRSDPGMRESNWLDQGCMSK